MNFEQPPAPAEDPDASKEKEHHDLDNVETRSEILLHGTEEELTALENHLGVSREATMRAREYLQMRKGVLETMRTELIDRISDEKKRVWNEEEQQMGAYKEEIEPQVRSAVQVLCAKGYPTMGSGFDGPDQSIIGAEGVFQGVDIDDATREFLKEKDVEITIEPSVIYLDLSKTTLPLGDIKAIWNRIADSLPPQKHIILAKGGRYSYGARVNEDISNGSFDPEKWLKGLRSEKWRS